MVWIDGTWWRLLVADPGPEDLGSADSETRTIKVRQGLSASQGMRVAAHESIHAACDFLDESAVLKLEEATVNAIEAYLAATGRTITEVPRDGA